MEVRLLYFSGVLALGVLAQWIAWRVRFPAILLLLLAGFAAGAVVDPRAIIGEELLYSVVSLAVAVVLFEGGLSLRLADLREGGQVILRLVTVGVLVTWALIGLAAWWLLGFDPLMAALVGAILSLTGPTVIGPLLQHVRPAHRVASIAKWEGIVIDPVAATLSVCAFEVVAAQTVHVGSAVTQVVMTGIVGTVVGLAAGLSTIHLLKRFLVPDFLQNAFLLTVVVGTFSLSNLLQVESGLVAVTVFGVALANQRTITVKHLVEFKEHLRVLLISTLFVVLASLVDLERMFAFGAAQFVFLAALLLIRPLAVLASTVGTPVDWRERIFLAWLAPRGIVSATVGSLFAVRLIALVRAGEDPLNVAAQAELLAPLVFFVIVSTVVIYGLTAAPLAARLGIAEPNPQGLLIVGAEAFARAIGEALAEEKYSVTFVDINRRNIAAARLAGLPAHCASILSDYVHDEIDLGGVGRLLAMTGSTEVNTLAALEFSHVFGRSNVYQLAVGPSTQRRAEPSPQQTHQLRARPLFGPGVTYQSLSEAIAEGATIKKTRLGDEFTYADFQAHYGDGAQVLFVIEPSGKLTVVSADQPLSPASGATLVSVVLPGAGAEAAPQVESTTA